MILERLAEAKLLVRWQARSVELDAFRAPHDCFELLKFAKRTRGICLSNRRKLNEIERHVFEVRLFDYSMRHGHQLAVVRPSRASLSPRFLGCMGRR